VPIARLGSSPTQRMSAGRRSEPRISPISPPRTPIASPLRTAVRSESPVRCSTGEEGSADHDSQGVGRNVGGGDAACDRPGDRRREHPADEPPVDASGPDMRLGRRGGREARDGDVGAARRRRGDGGEQEHRQADVAENEPGEAAGEGDDEAPDAHTDQQQRVHRLNKTR
jgi:hypothetical protein